MGNSLRTRHWTAATNLSARGLSGIARKLYPTGPVLFRMLQSYRPFICPFGELMIEVPAGASVLDIGCGAGLFLGLLAATGHRIKGIGFDVSKHGIALAKAMGERVQSEQSTATLQFLRKDAEDPWPSGPFDVVTMIDVLHHVAPSAQEEVIRRACRTTPPGGTFLYKDMCSDSAWRATANRLHDLVLARQWIHYVSPDRVECWAKQEGLELVRRDRINLAWYGHDLRVFRRDGTSTKK